MHHGGSAYLLHMLGQLSVHGFAQVPDAPVLEQPVYLATHIWYRRDPIVMSAARLLQELIAAGSYDG